jgi:hypothetical protein
MNQIPKSEAGPFVGLVLPFEKVACSASNH